MDCNLDCATTNEMNLEKIQWRDFAWQSANWTKAIGIALAPRARDLEQRICFRLRAKDLLVYIRLL